jgi:squalene-hopene/tetraprenyl-beta-curcumene cyclase
MQDKEQKSEERVESGHRITRRDFNIVTPLAAVPAILGANTVEGKSVPSGDRSSKAHTNVERGFAGIDRALQFLHKQSLGRDGAFGSQASVGITALAAAGMLRCRLSPHDSLVSKSLALLVDFIDRNERSSNQAGMFANYETCLAMMALKEANTDGRYDRQLRKAETFVKQSQWDEAAGKESSDPTYGGAGYGKHKRPDLSNTAFLIDALKASGRGADDPAVMKALTFVSRCQNLETEHNTTPFADKNPDGGFYYTPAAGGDSPAGILPNGGLRSYGSMTYSGLKSMIYAGVKADDPRVKAAIQWIRNNYDLQSNPGGMGTGGLYYYYQVFAKAMDALGEDRFVDAAGKEHDWRRELAEELFSRQKENGSWVNDNARWMEGDPDLVTSYALLSLSYCMS